ncbi:hypothetical protein U0070_003445 [Myodes glareolus]|uniref:Shikimate dehydrogenase substrate binding N-terminal domain-containing protein n=1 Tax=Myodes glareolus TaxID=447135 RepID=A0AAW0JUE6_MYOGA
MEKKEYALGVLGHPLGHSFAPVAYLSKKLDFIAQSWASCICTFVTTELLNHQRKSALLPRAFHGRELSHQAEAAAQGCNPLGQASSEEFHPGPRLRA